MVLLKKDDVFKTVIPSKIFEAMAMERPIILGVEGECKDLIEEAGCGICIEPENDAQLASVVLSLYRDRKKAERLGVSGRLYVKENYDRDVLAERYLETLKRVRNGNLQSSNLKKQG